MARKKQRMKDRKTAAKQQRKQQQMVIAGVVGAIVVGIALFLILRPDPWADVPDNSTVYSNQGQEHIQVGDDHIPYNSNPPTSGPHANSLSLDVYTQQFPDENIMHNLEHGHVWLSYRDATDTEAIQLLTTLQQKYPRIVLMTYRPENDNRIVAAAWTRLLLLDELDSDQVEAFINRWNNKSPESVPG
jgi:Protein of unknown function (DUF3105)